MTLFAIGFFPYLFILMYSHNLGEEKILENALIVHKIQIRDIKNHIDEQLQFLNKEIRFLSSLDMMNDMIVGDIDKRIAQVLIQKQKDLNLDMHLFALDKEFSIIASSSQTRHFKYAHLFQKALNNKEDYFFTEKNLMLFTKIYSSLDNNVFLGYLLSEYALTNLQNFTIHEKGIRSMLYNPSSSLHIGEVYQEEFSEKYIVLQERLKGFLSQWFVVYMIEKSVALAFLDAFILFLWGLFAFGFVVIMAISWWLSRRILEPIAQLSQATKSIISTKDYSTQVSQIAKGEIGELTDDFNAMIRETHHAFSVLEKENTLRLFRFVQLINIFSAIIQTQKEEDCIAVAIKELEKFMPNQQFSFSYDFPHKKDTKPKMMLYMRNFKDNTHDFYGVIYLNALSQLSDEYETKFYRSIATMIMLQLEHIHLIHKTQAVSQAKSTFISHISHELRTPLHMILSSTQYLIGYENLTHAQQKTIVTMESSADHLLGMINDILDLAEIEAGKVIVNLMMKSSDEIIEILENIISMLEVLAEQKGVSITLESRVQEEVLTRIDIKLFKQIIINLLSNAIKFTDKGSIHFLIKLSKNTLIIEIKDTGIGISKENLHTLFDDFSQVKNSKTNIQKGSGLGLVISQKLARLFDAEVKLLSEGEGKGSTALMYLNF